MSNKAVLWIVVVLTAGLCGCGGGPAPSPTGNFKPPVNEDPPPKAPHVPKDGGL